MEHRAPLPASNVAFAFDKKARKALLPYRETAPVKAIDWFSQVGDQTQMRLLAGAVLALGLVLRDVRMMAAGARMLAAHELATVAKTWVKDRVIRSRPRSTKKGRQLPRKGHDTSKEKSSFPSGHAAGAMAAGRAFAAAYPEHAVAAQAAAGAVGLGRIPACAHYPSDVAAGAAIGAGASAVVTGAWRVAARGLAWWAARR